MEILQWNLRNTSRTSVIEVFTKEDTDMLKFLAKAAEKYAKATNTACFIVWVFHQPKMPASMIKKED